MFRAQLLAALFLPLAFAQSNADLKEQVRKTEIAFAKTMANRDHAAFTSFLADEAVFFGEKVTRGSAAVAAGNSEVRTGKLELRSKRAFYF